MATLVYSDVDGVDRSFALGSDPVVVGRAAECAIRSDDPRVSRMHARFYIDQGTLWVEDLGSSNGIYVGPNKVQRAPVPTSEIVLIGSLMIRLMPTSGSLPPPVGLHGTLAQWLDIERKTRAAVEDERDAFAQRVGELHQAIASLQDQLKARKTPPTLPTDFAESVRLRDEAEAKAAALERALEAIHDEAQRLREQLSATEDGADLLRLRDELAQARGKATRSEAELIELRDQLAEARTSQRTSSNDLLAQNRLRDELAAAQARIEELEKQSGGKAAFTSKNDVSANKARRDLEIVKAALEEAQAARSVAEHASGEAMRDAQAMRDELDKVRRASQKELESLRVELSDAGQSLTLRETTAGIAAAEKLAEADITIANLKRELDDARVAINRATETEDPRLHDLQETVTVLAARAEKAERDLQNAAIRAQGAERNLAAATAQAAKAEQQVAQLEQHVSELAKAKETIVQLESKSGPLQQAESRAAKLAIELGELKKTHRAQGERVAELERVLANGNEVVTAAEQRAEQARTELAAAAAKLTEAEQKLLALQGRLADADQRGAQLQGRVEQLAKAEGAIAVANKSREDAHARAAASEIKASEAQKRADDAEKRASAADTMAKAMAKDVAEALRRAVEADTRARGVARDLDGAYRRAEGGEAAAKTATEGLAVAEKRASDAETRAAQVERELTEQLSAVQQDLSGKLETTQNELRGKLDSVTRELAAERSSSLQIVDRKTQLERDLTETKAQVPVITARAEAAEKAMADYQVQVDTLRQRVDNLTKGVELAESARQTSLAEAQGEIARLREQLTDAQAATAKAEGVIGDLRARIAELEASFTEAQTARGAVETALREANLQIEGLRKVADASTQTTEAERQRVEEALARAGEAERKIDTLTARAETADLAIGRANALQRQLDEALAKLAYLERDNAAAKKRESGPVAVPSEAIANDRIAAAEERTREAESRAKMAEDRIAEAERRAELAKQEAGERVGELERRATRSEEATKAHAEAEKRARELETRLGEVERRMRTAEDVAASSDRQLTEARAKLQALEKEVAAADNVRSFAAETEREIAQLQREVRDARAKLTQMTLERDRLASELRDAREDSDTTNRAAPQMAAKAVAARKPIQPFDPDQTAQADMQRYEALIQKVKVLEGDEQSLRAQLAEAHARLRDAIDNADEDSTATRTGSQLPIALAEHVNVLEEAIDSLRANMRAASDETAMMDPNDSVMAVQSAVSQAEEHLQRARAAVRALAATIGAL